MTQDWLNLGGKRAVVTGAAGGIGRAIARSLVEAGVDVALLDRDGEGCANLAADLTAAGFRAIAAGCDIAAPSSVAAAAKAVTAVFPAIDIVVNNAGILRASSLAEIGLAGWNELLSVNLTGYLLVAQAFRPALLAAGGGALVHIASIAASNPQPRSGAYSASKAGVAMLSRQIALEWGPDGIRSNIVSPGFVRTPMSESFYQAPGVKERREAMVPLRRIAGPQDIADAVVYLASPRAAYVTGAEILVDGGLDQMVMELSPRPGF
ncbi:MAG: SDR family NAD(P)-dependent oxidoreductase [Alphaproteobacteria bacterium]|nr:SDR family NAD(P)-dependent oxidoreductase [Alphaproteobacteria bacterium]